MGWVSTTSLPCSSDRTCGISGRIG